MKKGKNKFGLKLEDFDSYTDYRNACNSLYRKSEKGKLARNKYNKSEKGKLSLANAQSKYIKSGKKYLTRKKYCQGVGRAIVNSIRAKRRASQLQRTVPWADLKAIKEFYKNCPKGYVVDHIIPLQGKNVSGLHVLNNLQYLTASENASKGNKYEHR
jgi:hypothetical protein